jgi:transcriptional regulator with XRE-family HTH domain
MNLKTPKELAVEIADRIRSVRCERGLTQRAAAQRSGMSLGSYRRFEQTGGVGLVSLLQIAQALRIDLDFNSIFKEKTFESLDEIERKSSSPKKSRVRGISTGVSKLI